MVKTWTWPRSWPPCLTGPAKIQTRVRHDRAHDRHVAQHGPPRPGGLGRRGRGPARAGACDSDPIPRGPPMTAAPLMTSLPRPAVKGQSRGASPPGSAGPAGGALPRHPFPRLGPRARRPGAERGRWSPAPGSGTALAAGPGRNPRREHSPPAFSGPACRARRRQGFALDAPLGQGRAWPAHARAAAGEPSPLFPHRGRHVG